jgi:two-component system copper resistance phosphate regulon response regulator CusR
MKPSQLNFLVVEDEPKVAAFLKSGLEESGYGVDVASDGITGNMLFSNGIYDLVVLDVNLPKKNGIELCREIRKLSLNTPVLMLTAMSTTKDKISGFNAGADDYLVKPFEFAELLARIRALLKRSAFQTGNQHKLNFHDLEMNLETFTVMRSGKKIDLTQKEFTLLEYLIRNKERVISRSEIAEKVWDISFNTGTNVIDVYINFLRKKVDKDFHPKLIHTMTGFGYVMKSESDES